MRTEHEHDLADHPAWSLVPDLTVAELTPEETQRYNIIGVPEIAAEDLDTWTVGELAEIVEMVRSIADVCDLEVVTRCWTPRPRFGLLHQGTLPFAGREGARLWNQLVETIAERWDDVIDAIDEHDRRPREVDMAALAAAEKEAAVLAERRRRRGGRRRRRGRRPRADDEDDPAEEDGPPTTPLPSPPRPDAEAEVEDEPPGFWEDVGIDPIRITTDAGDGSRCAATSTASRCSSARTAGSTLFTTRGALTRWLATDGAEGHDIAAALDLADVVARAAPASWRSRSTR